MSNQDITNTAAPAPSPADKETGKKHSLRIVYMGTPDFAVEALRRMVEGGYNVVGVVTMPDKAIGRHQTTLQPSPVKQYAVSHGLPVLQPEKLKNEAFLDALRALRPDVGVVVAFRMLPQVVWDMPRLGTFNLHAALLPQYRGAAPINWAIINGETQTGITTFFLDHDIDTGRVISRVPVPIGPDENAGDIHDRLMMLGGDLVLQTLDQLENGTVQSIPQSELAGDGELKPAPKIFRETCHIDWAEGTLDSLHNKVRGLSPYPAAWAELPDGRVIKIYRTHKEPAAVAHPIGTFLTDGKTELKVAVEGGYLHIDDLQLSGKRRMMTADFLRGTKI